MLSPAIDSVANNSRVKTMSPCKVSKRHAFVGEKLASDAPNLFSCLGWRAHDNYSNGEVFMTRLTYSKELRVGQAKSCVLDQKNFIHGRIRLLRTDYFGGKSQREMAELLEIPERTYQRYEQLPPQNLSVALLEKYARLGVNLNWLVLGVGDPLLSNRASNKKLDDQHIFIPLYKVSAAAGLCGIITGEYPEVEERFPFKRYWLKKKGYEGEKVSGLALIRARGESMEPTISDGEIMLVDLNEQVRVPEAIRNGAIYVVRWGITKEEISVKRVHLDWAERKAILISDNELYRPKEIDLTEYEKLQDFILARVIWVGKENI